MIEMRAFLLLPVALLLLVEGALAALPAAAARRYHDELADDTMLRQLQAFKPGDKPNKPTDPKGGAGVDHFFKRLEKFSLSAGAKPKRMVLAFKPGDKPNKPTDPKGGSGTDHFFKRLERFAFASGAPKP